MWKRFLRAFAITGAAALALTLALILLVDPLGVSPVAMVRDVGDSGLAVGDRRFALPRIVRSKNFDSFLVGSSTVHSVDPHWAEEAFGGTFANVALHGGTPHEMAQMVRLIGQSVPAVRRLILGVDVGRWCEANGYKQYRRDAVFPEWLYDKSRLDDFSALFNLDMVEWAYEQLKLLLGLDSPAVPANGYRNFLNEKLWTAARAKEKLYGSKGIAVAALDPYESPNLNLPSVPSQIFPDLRLLRQAADSLPATTELIVVIMPSHASSFLNDDKDERDTIEQCKRSIATEITYPRVTVLDFRIPSIWTRNDNNFWDRNHVRVGLAKGLVLRIKEAVERRHDAEDGVYRYLAGPGPTATTAR